MRIFKNSWFQRFCRKEHIDDDMLRDAAQRVLDGHIDADLGGGVLKQRLARPGQGKSGGYRTIILFLAKGNIFFVYAFAKNERGNIRQDELGGFRKLADIAFGLTDKQLTKLIENRDFFEVLKDDNKKISK